MDLDQLKQILDLVREHDLSELQVEHDGLKIRIRTNAAAAVMPVTVTPPAAPAGSRRAATAPGGPVHLHPIPIRPLKKSSSRSSGHRSSAPSIVRRNRRRLPSWMSGRP
jgi:hypothetical protein